MAKDVEKVFGSLGVHIFINKKFVVSNRTILSLFLLLIFVPTLPFFSSSLAKRARLKVARAYQIALYKLKSNYKHSRGNNFNIKNGKNIPAALSLL